MNLEVEVMDRQYTEWAWVNAATHEKVDCKLNPLELHLFSGDVVKPTGELVHSKHMASATIPGVLVVDGKTYGRSKNVPSGYVMMFTLLKQQGFMEYCYSGFK